MSDTPTATDRYCMEVCQGECCRKFCMSGQGLRELRAKFYALKRGSNKVHPDMATIYPMVESAGKVRALVDGKESRWPAFGCKNLSEGRCAIHDHRPDMCSGFGVDYQPNGYPECIYWPEHRGPINRWVRTMYAEEKVAQ
jgi:Fe-S-cluster containining protein